MSYPPTDYLGYTIKTKDRKLFKYCGRGIIFDTFEEASTWVKSMRDKVIGLDGCEVVSVQGDL